MFNSMKHMYKTKETLAQYNNTGWRTTADVQRELKAKSRSASKNDLEKFAFEAFQVIVESYCTDGGASSLQNVESLINVWRPVGDSNLVKGSFNMCSSVIEKGDIETLKAWEDTFIKAILSVPETKKVVLYHNKSHTIIRVVVEKISADLIRLYNTKYIDEVVLQEDGNNVDFLVIDNEIYCNKKFPENSLIISISE